jgi:hypothetical protein
MDAGGRAVYKCGKPGSVFSDALKQTLEARFDTHIRPANLKLEPFLLS